MGATPTRVLVVEDEAVLAMMIEDMLADAGYEVVGPAHRLDDAIAMARDGDFDIAVLDMNLGGRDSAPVAEVLRTRGIPFVYATGYGSKAGPGMADGSVMVSKPFTIEELGRAFAKVSPASGPRG